MSFAFLVTILACSGCVTNKRLLIEKSGGYAVGMKFQTNHRLVAFEADDGLAGRRIALAVLGPRARNARNHYGVDPDVLGGSCDESTLSCENNDEHVIAIVPAGIILTVIRIERRKGSNVWFGKHDDIIVFAKCPSGIKSICNEIDMTDLSILMRRDQSSPYSDEVLYAPDPSLLSTMD